MALIPSQDFNRAKKRMQMGLHPAVIAAVQKAMEGRTFQPQPGVHSQVLDQRLEPGVAAGSGVNQGGALNMAARAGKSYQTFLRQGPGGKVQEIHDYGGNLGSVTFDRKATPQIQQLLGQQKTLTSPAQDLSNTATAHDKLLAMAVRQASAGQLGGNPLLRRKFSRNPGILQRY